jgi:hypothetical protein
MLRIRFFLPAFALLAAGRLGAQQAAAGAGEGPRIAGIVKDAVGAPVPDVEVGVIKSDRLQQWVNTGSDGAFLLTGLSPGMVPIRIRRIGYAMQFLEIDSRSPASRGLEIVLQTVPSELENVTVEGNDVVKLHQFFEHRTQRGSFGVFLVQDEIRKLGATQPSDLFRTVPGVVVSTGSGGNVLRIRGCQPMVWIDGTRVPGAELDEVIHPSEIAAIEFYPSNAGAPPQYLERQNRLCGTFLVWTKTR